MNQPQLVGRVQAPGKLDGHVQDLVQPGELAVPYPLGQRAPGHELGEDRYLVIDRAEETATREVRMLGQIDPGLELVQKVALAVLVAELGRQNGLHGEPVAAGTAADQVD